MAAGVAVLAGAVIGRERLLELAAGPADLGPVDFRSLQPEPWPNHYLVCPADLCPPDVVRADPPEFPVSAARLIELLDGIAVTEPRTERVDDGTRPLHARYVVRSRRLRFPDTVSVEALPLGGDRSTIAVYSRAQFGRDDLGVNEARVERWLMRLQERARARTGEAAAG